MHEESHMTPDQHHSPSGGGSSADVAIQLTDSELLVTGSDDAVTSYLERITSLVGQAATVSGLDRQSLTDAAAVASSVGAIVSSRSGNLVQLDQHSMTLLRQHNVIPGTSGFNRMMVADSQGAFAGQLQWKSVLLEPTQALTIESAVVALMLRTAIQGVEEAVAAVQQTANTILQLAQADRTGDVVGLHQALARLTRFVDDTGNLSTTDWQSIAGAGPQLEIATERLRSHVRKLLEDFDDSAPVQDRAVQIRDVLSDGILRDTLQLLVVAEDSAHLWQRLRIARVRDTEPDLLRDVVDSARATLADHAKADEALLASAQRVIDGYTTIRPFEFVRKVSGSRLNRDTAALQSIFDEFANARRVQIGEWANRSNPTIVTAVKEAGHRIGSSGKRTALGARDASNDILDRSAAGIGSLGARMQKIAQARAERGNKNDLDAS